MTMTTEPTIRFKDLDATLSAAGVTTVAELATKADLPPDALLQVVENRGEPSPLMIARLMRETGLDFDDLFYVTQTSTCPAWCVLNHGEYVEWPPCESADVVWGDGDRNRVGITRQVAGRLEVAIESDGQDFAVMIADEAYIPALATALQQLAERLQNF